MAENCTDKASSLNRYSNRTNFVRDFFGVTSRQKVPSAVASIDLAAPLASGLENLFRRDLAVAA